MDSTQPTYRVSAGSAGAEFWAEVPLEGRWFAAYRLASENGVPVVAELRIAATPPPKLRKKREPLRLPDGSRFFPGAKEFDEIDSGLPALPRGGLGARVVRKVVLGAHRRFAREFINWWERQRLAAEKAGKPEASKPGFVQGLGFSPNQQPTRTRTCATGKPPGRKPRPLIFYARWTQRYERLANGARGRSPSRRPCADLAVRHRIPETRVRDYVREARRLGLLTPATISRVAGGTLTEKAQVLLGSAKRERGRRRA